MRPILGEVITAITVLMLASLSCNAQSQEAAISPAATATAEVRSLLRDSFSTTGSGWDTHADHNSSVEYDSGGLHMRTFTPGYFTWSNPSTAAYDDVHVEVTARDLGSDAHASFGIVCGQQPDAGSYYYFAITPAGQYMIGKSVMGQQVLSLTGEGRWSATDLIPTQAESYRLGADCGSGIFTLYVNGKVIDSVRDTGGTRGEIGLFLWSGTVASADVLYDDFVVTRLK